MILEREAELNLGENIEVNFFEAFLGQIINELQSA